LKEVMKHETGGGKQSTLYIESEKGKRADA